MKYVGLPETCIFLLDVDVCNVLTFSSKGTCIAVPCCSLNLAETFRFGAARAVRFQLWRATGLGRSWARDRSESVRPATNTATVPLHESGS
jgi:hypothetical protein